MDLFTHIVVAYLITFGLTGGAPQYLAAGALAGGLPDADILFFPLAKRFPILRHHGITHSLFGVTVVAVAGGLLAPMIVPGSALVYFVVMELGGVAHMLGDGFTHFSVPPLLPFSDRRLELDADRAINFVTLVVSVTSFYLLLVVERGHVAYSVYLLTVWLLAAFYLLYFGLRLSARVAVGRKIRRAGEFNVVVPTGNPISWIVLKEDLSGGRMTIRFARYTLGKGIVAGPHEVSAPTEGRAAAGTAPGSVAEAIERSYPLARSTSSILWDTYHFVEAAPESGGWSVVWYSLEFGAFGRAAAVRVRFAADGSATAKRAWYRPGSLGAPS